MTVKIRSRYLQISPEGISFDPDDPRNENVDCISQTKQEFKDDCDLNVILTRYRETGLIDVPVHEMIYGDFSNVKDYSQAFEIVSFVGEIFGRLPADVRRRFSNSPEEFLRFASDPANASALVDLGIVSEDVSQGVSGSGIEGDASSSGSPSKDVLQPDIKEKTE